MNSNTLNIVRSIGIIISVILLGLIALLVLQLRMELTSQNMDHAGRRPDWEDNTIVLESEHFNVSLIGFKDDIEVTAKIEGAVKAAEALLPQSVIDIIDVPLIFANGKKECSLDTAGCVNRNHDWMEVDGSSDTASLLSILLHEIGHIIGKHGTIEDGTNFYDTVDELSHAAGDLPVTDYAGTNKREFFAESFEDYVLNRPRLFERAPATYVFLQDLFGIGYILDGASRYNYRILPIDSDEMLILDSIDLINDMSYAEDFGIYGTLEAYEGKADNVVRNVYYAFPRPLRSEIRKVRKYLAPGISGLCGTETSCSSLEEGWMALNAVDPVMLGSKDDPDTYEAYFAQRRVWAELVLAELGKFFTQADGLLANVVSLGTFHEDEIIDGFVQYVIDPDVLSSTNQALYSAIDAEIGIPGWNRDDLYIEPTRLELEYIQELIDEEAENNNDE